MNNTLQIHAVAPNALGMSTFVRIAPSPTGYLHVGNIRTALVNWLFARKTGGRFMLRLDDTDQERSRPEYSSAIEQDLGWLGLNWDVFRKQSDHFADYEAAKQKLLKSGRLYPCWETQEELDIRRKMQAGRGLPPIYDRAALKLTEAQKADLLTQRKPHYRFFLEDKPIEWKDLVRGDVRFQAGHMSDPVLVREDGIPLYTFASVVDDGDTGITHVIRGEDHVSNTAVQVQIFEALGYKAPKFAHLALLKTKEGEMSKRVGGNDIRTLRTDGIEPMTINSLLARIGTSDAVEACTEMQELITGFDFSKFGRAPAIYDASELERLNAKLLHQLPFNAVKDTLTFADEAFWLSVRTNINKLSEAKQWWDIIHGDVTATRSSELMVSARQLLPKEAWDETTWGTWTKALTEASGLKGKDLFMPLRLALTGKEHGPEMKKLLPLIGYNKVLERLGG